MPEPCSISLYAEVLPGSLSDIAAEPLDVLFALGIVNPFGPTLTFLAAVGESEVGADLPLVRVMLNPFAQTVERVGRFRVGDVWVPAADLAPLLAPEFWETWSCPTLVLLNQRVQEGDQLELAAKILASFGDGVVTTVRQVRKHLGDPGARVFAETRGEEADTSGDAIEGAAMALAELVMKPRHIHPELQAFLYAWDGAIEKTGIPSALKRSAVPLQEFRTIFADRVLPTLRVPEMPQDDTPREPDVARPQRLAVESMDALHKLLTSGTWVQCDEQRLVDLMRVVLFVYGQSGDRQYIPHLAVLYRHALATGMGVETRMKLEGEMAQLILDGKVSPVVFLPFLVEDADVSVTTRAAIDFVSSSHYMDNELYAFIELRILFSQGVLADRAAVFGALVAMGDTEVMRFVEELKPQLTEEEVHRAARVHTQFPQHHAIQFWLSWCKELASSRTEDSLARFGSCASALTLVLRHDQVGEVREGKRNFPCQKSEPAISRGRRWSLEEYAEVLAPELYALEASEDPPRIFSSVLRAWGLEPRAPLDEQAATP